MGRNIWQNDNPVAMIKAINAIVHEGATDKEALDVFNAAKGKIEEITNPSASRRQRRQR